MGEWADRVDAAIADVLAQGVATADIATEGARIISTSEMGDMILEALKKQAA